MIYVTGDTHGDISRFKSRRLRKLKKNDYLVICGDFGFIWDGSARERRLLKWIGRRRYHVVFVEGSHDNYTLLSQYPISQWNGGAARQISGRLYHLCRGHVFDLEDNKIFAFGGGESYDLEHRADSPNWWREELPTCEEIDAARENLDKAGGKVDFVVTHQPSGKIKQTLSIFSNEPTILDDFLDEVRKGVNFKRWFFGSLHLDMLIPPGEVALFEAFVPMSADSPMLGAKKRRRMRL